MYEIIPNKIIFLCQEPADYLFNCITTLCRQNSQLSVFVVYKEVPLEAPFNLEPYTADNLILLRYEKLKIKDIKVIIKSCSSIFVTGWRDKKYLPAYILAKINNKKVIWCFDNPWRADIKQLSGLLLIYLFRILTATNAFVTGNAQYTYARKLGFPHTRITTGLYIANEKRFYSEVKSPIQKRFIYVGRILDYKWVLQLTDAFLKIKVQVPNDWKLIIIGNGPLSSKLQKDSSIEYIKFLQPEQLVAELKKGGVACIPSRIENWGVVVHEFALLGLPILASDKVYAASKYLIHNYNGYLFKANDYKALENTLKFFIKLTDSELSSMGPRSMLLAGHNNLDIWCNKVKNFTY